MHVELVVKKGDVAGDISTRMPIELCSPQDKFLHACIFNDKFLVRVIIINNGR